MTTRKRPSSDGLRTRAEARATGMPSEPCEGASPEALQRALHELRVHQIEVEMQNEELRRAQADLSVLHTRYVDLYDLAPVAYCTVDAQGRIERVNLTMTSLLSTTRSALVGQQMSQLVFEADQSIYYQLRRTLSRNGSLQACELRLVNSSGTPIWTSVQATVEAGAGLADGGVVRLALMDITARRSAEAALEQQRHEQAQLAKTMSLNRMAGAVAHHFNNDLGAVILALDMALQQLHEDSEPAQVLRLAVGSTRKAAGLADNMLKCLGASRQTDRLLDLSAVVEEARAQMLVDPTKNAPDVYTDLPSSGPMIMGDAKHIALVVSSLIANAQEAGGAYVRVAIRSVPANEISAAHRFPLGWKSRAGTYVCLEVADHGSGIAPGDFERIFDPFFSTKSTGRGLGLPVSLGLVQASDGAITVESTIGQGSVFRVFWPSAVQA